ncbi:DUF4037 domain-containing protein [Streptomyces sp. SID13031]|uniref:DUF4037 domain-containing protein n=1 Tax=Streptomyces sp. SID13031 TaxID=2706046 RepID=UPI0013C7E268|nr:DUF4037 domain-containing protein [Streptomyces sp. SID13031]NEA31442.1 DUF4037 domain-containing protein [Streptomyces sp. SID13031]
MADFVPGLELSRLFYSEAVRPILESRFPGLEHSAALIGRGSEVLGFDDELSTDHDWKPRVLLFLREENAAVGETLQRELPAEYRGRPIDFAAPGILGSVEVHTVRSYFQDNLSLDVDGEIAAFDWLTFPEQGLRTFTAGAVHHDEVGLQAVRDRLAYYPHDVWLYLLVAGWWRVHPEMNLVGRTGSVGDEVGSAVLGARLVSDLMRLCFLMERQYAPYSKWFGTAFSRLECGPELEPILSKVLHAGTWQERESALVTAYEKVGAMHNALQLTEPVSIGVEQMWDRPFKVAWADYPGLLAAQIQDPAVLSLLKRWPVGPVDQFRELMWRPHNRTLLLRVLGEEE